MPGIVVDDIEKMVNEPWALFKKVLIQWRCLLDSPQLGLFAELGLAHRKKGCVCDIRVISPGLTR